jgi:hypothetical protein
MPINPYWVSPLLMTVPLILYYIIFIFLMTPLVAIIFPPARPGPIKSPIDVELFCYRLEPEVYKFKGDKSKYHK